MYENDLAKIRQCLDLESLTTCTVSIARKMISSDGITFVLREGEMSRYVDETAIGPLWKGQAFPLSSCISGWSILFKETSRVHDITKDARIPQAAYRSTFVKSLLMVPIGLTEPIGALGCYWSTVHIATAEEQRALEEIAEAVYFSLSKLTAKAPISAPTVKFVTPAVLAGMRLLVAADRRNVDECAALSSYLSTYGADVATVQLDLLASFPSINYSALIWNHRQEVEDCRWPKKIEKARQEIGKQLPFVHLLDGSCKCNQGLDGTLLKTHDQVYSYPASLAYSLAGILSLAHL